MFVSCINLRKVTVSSSLHTDLMVSSAAIINIENAHVDVNPGSSASATPN